MKNNETEIEMHDRFIKTLLEINDYFGKDSVYSIDIMLMLSELSHKGNLLIDASRKVDLSQLH